MTDQINLDLGVKVQIRYKHTFACAIPEIHGFSVEFDNEPVIIHDSFHRNAGCILETKTGSHTISIQNKNKLSRLNGKKKPREIEFPKPGKYVIQLSFDSALGRWKKPVVTPLGTDENFKEIPSRENKGSEKIGGLKNLGGMASEQIATHADLAKTSISSDFETGGWKAVVKNRYFIALFSILILFLSIGGLNRPSFPEGYWFFDNHNFLAVNKNGKGMIYDARTRAVKWQGFQTFYTPEHVVQCKLKGKKLEVFIIGNDGKPNPFYERGDSKKKYPQPYITAVLSKKFDRDHMQFSNFKVWREDRGRYSDWENVDFERYKGKEAPRNLPDSIPSKERLGVDFSLKKFLYK